jgi:hypothetical protein
MLLYIPPPRIYVSFFKTEYWTTYILFDKKWYLFNSIWFLPGGSGR